MTSDSNRILEQHFLDCPVVDLSIVAPCFNEEDVLDEFIRRVKAVCEAYEGTYEIVLVNDGSTDGTWAKMQEFVDQDSHVVAVDLSRNHGHELATTTGLSVCRGERIMLLDADLQDPPELLPDMAKVMEAESADVVYGVRRTREGETTFKRISSSLYYRLLDILTDTDIALDAGDFRLMSRRMLNAFLDMPEQHRFVRGMMSWVGFKQVPFLYDRPGRQAGKTKYALRSLMSLAIIGVTSFSTRPLAIASCAGALTGCLALLLIVYAIVSWFNGAAAGWPSLMAVVATIGSVQLLVLGVMGEYLGRMYEQSKSRPLFILRNIYTHRGSGEGTEKS